MSKENARLREQLAKERRDSSAKIDSLERRLAEVERRTMASAPKPREVDANQNHADETRRRLFPGVPEPKQHVPLAKNLATPPRFFGGLSAEPWASSIHGLVDEGASNVPTHSTAVVQSRSIPSLFPLGKEGLAGSAGAATWSSSDPRAEDSSPAHISLGQKPLCRAAFSGPVGCHSARDAAAGGPIEGGTSADAGETPPRGCVASLVRQLESRCQTPKRCRDGSRQFPRTKSVPPPARGGWARDGRGSAPAARGTSPLRSRAGELQSAFCTPRVLDPSALKYQAPLMPATMPDMVPSTMPEMGPDVMAEIAPSTMPGLGLSALAGRVPATMPELGGAAGQQPAVLNRVRHLGLR